MHVSLRRSLFAIIVAVLLFSGLSPAQQTDSLVSQITQINQHLQIRPRFVRPSREALPSDQLPILQARQKLVEELISTDPAAVRSVMLPSALATELRASSPEFAAAVEAEVQWSGSLEAAIADDFVHGSSVTHWYLNSGDQRMELFFAAEKTPSLQLHRPVTVNGVGTARVISVESMRIVQKTITAQAPPALNCTSLGVEDTAVLIMNQPNGGTAYPDPAFATSTYWQQDYFGVTPKSVNNFWQEASFGLTSGIGDFYGPLTFSANEDCTNTDALAADAINAAQAQGVNFSNYSRISIIYPISSCNFGGLGTVGCYAANTAPANQISHPYSITWIPVFSYYDTTNYDLWGLIAHELGHNLGLHHSSSINFGSVPLGAIDYVDPYPTSAVASNAVGVRTEYGDPYTVMGGGSYTCGAQYTAFNKSEYLGWMNRTSDVAELTSTGGVFKVVPFESSTGLRALRVLRDPLTSSWLWLEYRQPLGNYDSALSTCASPSNILSGANVYYESPFSSDGHLFLLNMNAATTPNNFNEGALTVGHTWSDPNTLLTFTVNSADSTGMNVSASFDQPCAALQISSGGSFPAAGGTGTITVTAPNTCSWTATTVDGWITINSGATGTGNGSVGFTVAANAGTFQTNGYITVQRQSVAIAEAGAATLVSNLSPTLESGISGIPLFTFNDPLGPADISYINLKIHDSDCQVQAVQSSGSWFFFLFDPATGEFSTTAVSPGQNQSLSNANCTLNGLTSTVSINGNQLQLGLSLTFAPSFAGSYRVAAAVCDTANGSPSCSDHDVSIGTWQVPPPVPSISSVTPNAGKQGALLPITIIGTNSHFSSASVVTVGGVGVSAGSVNASSATQLTTTLNIDMNAAAGARTLSVTTGGEAVTSTFTVIASGHILFSSYNMNLGHQVTHTTGAAQPVTLTNNGNAPLAIASVVASSEFAVSHNCGASLAAGASCTLNVTFTPGLAGIRTGSVSINDDAPGSPHVISVTGIGDFLVGLVRPGRPTRPTAVNPGIISKLMVTVGDVGTIDPSRVTCRSNRKLSCFVDASGSEQNGLLKVFINSRRAKPGRYILFFTFPEGTEENTFTVPLVVKAPARPTRRSR